jgi:hypothetical protein
MKNGTQSKLTLVDQSGHAISNNTDVEDIGVEFVASQGSDDPKKFKQEIDKLSHNKVLFITICITCATAAIAAGSYAAYLSRHKATQEALTDVHDILKVCQDRMVQMEKDLNKLPKKMTSAKS